MVQKVINIENMDEILNIFGNYDENINIIQKYYRVTIIYRGSEIKIEGDEGNVNSALNVISTLISMASEGDVIDERAVSYVISISDDCSQDEIKALSNDAICVTVTGKVIKPKTIGQKKYVDSIKNNTIAFGIGPAGTGKTFLAVAMAVKSFKAHEINKIILTRPAVEAGEKLGFLPGDLQDKVDPYLRPLYDALFEMFGAETFAKYLEKGIIEVAPLAYMRGRTLDDSFIILDEAQNTSGEQMKMFLTRLGFNSKMVITGDITQIDLPDVEKCGLKQCTKILNKVEDISINRLTQKDVVRHKLVQDIVKAYEKYYEKKEFNR